MKLKLFVLSCVHMSSPTISYLGLRKEEQTWELFNGELEREGKYEVTSVWGDLMRLKVRAHRWKCSAAFLLIGCQSPPGQHTLGWIAIPLTTCYCTRCELQRESFPGDSARAVIWQLRLDLCKWACFDLGFLYPNYLSCLASSFEIEISLTILA